MGIRVKLDSMLLCTASLLAFSGQAVAQTDTSTAAPAGLDEIVVTAQRRNESIQKTPVTVSALSAEAVGALHTPSIAGLQGTVPGLQIKPFLNNPDSAIMSIRGIGSFEPYPFQAPTVGVVADGVPHVFNKGALVELFDVERVEVLKGPQGTLFGANTTGGVINIISRQPTNEFTGHAEATYGNYDRIDVTAALNVPLSDAWAFRVAASNQNRNGYVRNVLNNQTMGDVNHNSVRGIMQYAPTKDFKAALKLESVTIDDRGAAVNGSYPGQLAYTGLLPPFCQPNKQCEAPDKLIALAPSPNLQKMKASSGTLTLNVNDTPLGDIVSITGYKRVNEPQLWADQGSVAPAFNMSNQPYKSWTFTQELRTDARVNERFNFTAGAFYIKDQFKLGGTGYLGFAIPRSFIQGSEKQDHWASSIFGQAYFNVTEKLQLLAGIRYTHDDISMLATNTIGIVAPDFDYSANGPLTRFGYLAEFPGPPPGSIIITSVAPPKGSKSWNNIGAKVGANYQFSNEAMAYAHWARGFKSGGFVGRIGLPTDIGPFGPEKVDAYEIGAKTDWFDQRARLNVAAFWNIYHDLQQSQTYTVSTTNEAGDPVYLQGFTIQNAPKAEAKGVEAEGRAIVGGGFSVNGSVTYLDAKYKDFPLNQGLGPDGLPRPPIQLAGIRIIEAPKWQFMVGATYEFALFHGRATAHAQYGYTGRRAGNVTDAIEARVGPDKLLDANFDWTPDDKWGFSVWVRNLTDEHRFSSMFADPVFGEIGAYFEPRMYGVSVHYDW